MNLPAVSVSLIACLLSLSAAPAAARAQDDGPATTPDDVKAAYEKKDYKETLRLLGRVLALRGNAAAGVDRHEMLLLKAESHLHMKGTANAIQALEEAAKTAPDDKSAAKSRALVILIRRSKNLQYTPKPSAGGEGDAKAKGPFDITDPDQRKAALEGLYREEKVAARAKVQAAEKAKTLPPLATALKAVVPLKDLELAATDHDAETAETLNQVTDRAHKLMARELDEMTKRTERIAARARELYQYSVATRDGGTRFKTGMRGLQQKDVQELKAAIKTCQQIVASCKELAEGFAEEDEPFEDLEDLARTTGERAHEVLNDDYTLQS